MIGCGPYTTRSCIHFFSLSKKEYDAWSNHFWIVYNTHSFESHGLQGKGKTKKRREKIKKEAFKLSSLLLSITVGRALRS
jgi:hypothetical protein